MKFFNLLPLIVIYTLTLSYLPKTYAADELSGMSCSQLKTQLNALTAKMKRSPTSTNKDSAVSDVIWGGLVGQQIKKSNGSVGKRINQLKRHYAQKC